jgi:hypothetical protein
MVGVEAGELTTDRRARSGLLPRSDPVRDASTLTEVALRQQ